MRQPPLMRTAREPGYVFLLSILSIGVIAISATLGLLFVGLSASKGTAVNYQSNQALVLARTCTERALRSLRRDNAYAGDQTMVLSQGTCQILKIGGSGNTNRTLCVLGQVDDVTRRLEINIQFIVPTTSIAVWKEVAAFSLCPS